MKKIFTILLSFFSLVAIAQYTTPSTGVNWNFDSLLNNSTAVTGTYPNYTITQDILISKFDTLRVDSNINVLLDDAVEMEINGALRINPKDSAVFTASNPTRLYAQVRIDSSVGTYINKAIFEYGGGLNVIESDFTVENSTFRFNEAGNDGALDLFRANLIIRNNHIHDNEGPAVKSGANIASAPQIINNLIERNVANGSNQSQINFGATGADTLMIQGNTINGLYTNAGGIAIFPLGSANVVIDSNVVDSNRYGIALLNAGVNAFINNNRITNNDIQNNPNLGGSGINLMGSATVTAKISRNVIYGNLWGITIQNTAKPNIGDLRSATYNVGLNEIYNNGNGGVEFNIYNNTPDSVYAQNNIWNYPSVQAVENTIVHETDNSSLGFVNYLPLNQLVTGLIEQVNELSATQVYPNPASSNFRIQADYTIQNVEWYNLQGQLVRVDKVNATQVELSEMNLNGQFLLKLIGEEQTEVKRIVLR